MIRTTAIITGLAAVTAAAAATAGWPLGRSLGVTIAAGWVGALIGAAIAWRIAWGRALPPTIDWHDHRAVRILEDYEDPESFWRSMQTWTTEPATPSA